LLTGASVLLVPESLGIEGLSDTLDSAPHLSLLKLTPAHMDTLKQKLDPERLSAITSSLVIGGEPLLGESLAFWKEHAPQTRVINEYGPTETVVGCCVYETSAGETAPGPVPIGRPIANTRLYVLDGSLQPVPLGVAGELYIGGAQLARGYLRCAGLTAERFVPDPYASEPGERLYQTGDLVRYLPDGNLMFVGRRDQQVKVRGYRIELGEIEAALDSHPAVEQSVVLVNEQGSSDKQLVAYIVATSHQAVPLEPGETSADVSAVQMDEMLRYELRGHLRTRLPEYMIPTTFLLLKRMPLTASGKVDRKALAAFSSEKIHSDRVYVPPSSDVEKVLADTWSEILRVPQISIHDNFFELGGDSIRGMQVVAKLNQARLRLTSTQLFEHPTIAELATLVEVNGHKQSGAREEEISGDVPLTPIQHWFFTQPLPNPHHFNQALMFEVPAHLDADALATTLTRVIEHHDALRLRFTHEGDVWRQINAPAGEPAPFERFDLSALDPDEQHAALTDRATELQASLNLSDGPLLRAAYFNLGAEQKGRLLLLIHHLCVDGVSWRVLLEDLRTGYEQLRQGEQVRLPGKTTSFKRWAERLAEYAQSEELQSEAAYWLEAVPEEVALLPVDYPAGTNTVGNEQHVRTRLEAEQTRALLQEVPKALRTEINDVLLTALTQAVGEWSGEEQLLVDVEGHGRETLFEDVNVSRTVGWFTSIYPVLLETGGTRGGGELLKTVKERLRAIPRRGVGYGLLRYLREADELTEQLNRHPAAQILFNYLGQLDDATAQDSPFAPARESSGPTRSADGARRYLLEVTGSVEGGELHMVWTYSGVMYERATIERVAEEYLRALRELVARSRAGEGVGLTAADFPKAKLKQEHLDKLLTKLKRNSEQVQEQ
jgi:non-ribosomal peptide synthase protein (TIGR01720 family)